MAISAWQVKHKRCSLLVAALVFFPIFLIAQDSATKKFTFNGFADLYYSYDFSNPPNHEKADFIYNHKRHNEINFNLITAGVKYIDAQVRGNLALMAGNYAQYNLSAEPEWAQFIYEANMGVKLSHKKNIWLDAGIMPSHLGFESAISSDCWVLTRNLVSEGSPYYETGLKLSYTGQSDKLSLALLLLNGWQRIKKPDYIQQPSFGMQVNYRASDQLTLNYSNFIGTDQPGSIHALRTYHDIYVQYTPAGKFGIIAGFDLGLDKYNSTDYGVWYTPVVIVRYTMNPRLNLALRGEYFHDAKQIIVKTGTANGFQTTGLSANIDYAITEKIQFRFETKYYNSVDPIFSNSKRNNFSLTGNLAIRL